MENIDISYRAELQLQILQLKAEQSNHVEAISQSFNDLTQNLFVPAILNKKAKSETSDDHSNGILDVSKLVVNSLINYLLEQKFGTKRSFNDFIASMFIEIISAPFVNQKIVELFSEIGDQVFNETDENN